MVEMPQDCPLELWVSIQEFFPEEDWIDAVNIAREESNLDSFALADTTTDSGPCGTPVGRRGGVLIVSERSVGYFQINSCNFPAWEWQRFYNARHNAGTAHLLWQNAGRAWSRVWYFSAQKLGLS